MKSQKINFKDKKKSYSVIIGKNILNLISQEIKRLCPRTNKIVIVIDKNVPKKFKSVLKHDFSSKIVFSCGSGVTASVLALAYSLIDNKYNPVIYDGSWSEYGRI